ncbi:hypothetical protein ACNTMW_25255 [Planosporangium sp. 12N6]|uniref:hypothetical protein n=1 Tax=Planosporangium spinosum TaxID=3402278 RepID=UPI003CEC5D99
MSAHQPIRPNWVCVGCGYPWPCRSRKRQFCAEYIGHPAALALVLSAAMVEASADLRTIPAGDLHDRFVGWLPHPV